MAFYYSSAQGGSLKIFERLLICYSVWILTNSSNLAFGSGSPGAYSSGLTPGDAILTYLITCDIIGPFCGSWA